jgi:hypothetical protein
VLTTDVPRLTADECEKISRAMYDSKNEDFVVLHEIDNTIISENQFSKVSSIELWNHSTDLVSLEQGFCRFDDTINKRDCVEDRVAGDKVFDVLKIVSGS